MNEVLSWTTAPVLVIGAGIMGAGIAQVAAQAGHPVFLFDLREGASSKAKQQLEMTLSGLVAKGRLSEEAAKQTVGRITAIASLEEAGSALLAVEAIVENLEAKRTLLRQLEELLPSHAILATNTSSISVTAIANGLRHPERVVGMHFFNPVPLMKLVEVVHGLQTQQQVAETIFELAKGWGKVPVHAKSTPGFIVNRIARPFYAEALAILQEQGAQPHEIDACLVAAGFRMGPCALMDLIGHDTNFAVTQSVYAANFFDKRFVPSIVQKELVDGGLLGRKAGRGFYTYGPDGAAVPPLSAVETRPVVVSRDVVVHGSGLQADWLANAVVAATGGNVTRAPSSVTVGLVAGDFELVMTDGRCAWEISSAHPERHVAVFDRFNPRLVEHGRPLPLAYTAATAEGAENARSWLAALGFHPVFMKDSPGLVVARTIAMLANEAADAVTHGVCDEFGADSAMKLGVNYPAGPFEWVRQWNGDLLSSCAGIAQVLDCLDAYYRGERYRVSPWIRERAAGAQPPLRKDAR
ncbi:MAG: 3-hydroxyacyl-CoA dehydrogenase [Proteobacteria bacterium]|nr:3-hydroxyacyl-CoA dehydrogenase [Pseudomonadota bacterium]